MSSCARLYPASGALMSAPTSGSNAKIPPDQCPASSYLPVTVQPCLVKCRDGLGEGSPGWRPFSVKARMWAHMVGVQL